MRFNFRIMTYILAALTTMSFTTIAEARSSIDFDIQCYVQTDCGITNLSIPGSTTLSLDTTNAQTVGDLGYRCKGAQGFTRTITSANNGVMKFGNLSIPYLITHTGKGGLEFTDISLGSTQTTSHNKPAIFSSGEDATISIRIPRTPENLLAGIYTDIIYIDMIFN
jgi:hypothetical protein